MVLSRRQQLLDTLADHVQQHGLDEPTVRQLAEAAGVPHQTLTDHFGSRSELMADIFGRINERTAALSNEGPQATYEERLRSMWTTLTGPAHREIWSSFYEVFGTALRDPDLHREFLQHVSTDWTVPLMAELIEAGFGGAEAASTATFVVGAMRGLVIDALAGGDSVRVDAAFEILLGYVRDVTSR